MFLPFYFCPVILVRKYLKNKAENKTLLKVIHKQNKIAFTSQMSSNQTASMEKSGLSAWNYPAPTHHVLKHTAVFIHINTLRGQRPAPSNPRQKMMSPSCRLEAVPSETSVLCLVGLIGQVG